MLNLDDFHKEAIDLKVTGGHIKGFTLVEMLVSIAIMGVIATITYSIYFSMTRTYMAQEQVVDTQQSLRIALKRMVKNLRMAGLEDPLNRAGAGVIEATSTRFRFTLDRTGGEGDTVDNDGDGTTDEADESSFPDGRLDDRNEDMAYEFDSAGKRLLETSGAENRVIVENIEHLEFYYHLDGAAPALTTSPAATRYADIRAVEIAVLARTARQDTGYSQAGSFSTASGVTWAVPADGFRYRFLQTTVRCRNMGL